MENFFLNQEGNHKDNKGESWPCRQDAKLTSPLTHSQQSTMLTQIHNSVISKQTGQTKEQVTIGPDLKGISSDL